MEIFDAKGITETASQEEKQSGRAIGKNRGRGVNKRAPAAAYKRGRHSLTDLESPGNDRIAYGVKKWLWRLFAAAAGTLLGGGRERVRKDKSISWRGKRGEGEQAWESYCKLWGSERATVRQSRKFVGLFCSQKRYSYSAVVIFSVLSQQTCHSYSAEEIFPALPQPKRHS